MPDGGLRADDLRQCVQVVLALRKNLDATSIAEVLWLAAGSDSDAAIELPSPSVATTPTAPRRAETDDEPPGGSDATRPGRGPSQPGAGALVTGRRVRVQQAKPFPEQLNLGRSLLPFKRRWPLGRRMRLDIDATIHSYTRTWQLVPVFSPAPERWFEVALVVDDSPSMSVWTEEVVALSRVLRQAGTFKAIRSYRLSLTGTNGAPDLLNECHHPYDADQLSAPDGRRLIVILTDGAAPGWRRPPIWKVIRTWATSTPTVLVSPLAPRLWRQTGLDLPAVRTGPAAPGSPNAMLKYSVPFHLREPGQPLRSWLPVPSVTLSPYRLGRWAKTLMRTDPVGCEALLIPPEGRPDDDEAESRLPFVRDSVSTFLRLAAPEAARLAVLCSLFETVDLGLLRLIRQELVPTASTGDLAELIVSGLFLPPTAAPDGEYLRFHENARAALLETLTESDAWRVYDMLSGRIDSDSSAARTFPATVPDPAGDVVLRAESLPFAAASRDVLDFLDVLPETVPVAEGRSSTVEAVPDVPASPAVPYTDAESLFRAVHADLARAAYGLLGNHADVDDAVQNGFYKLMMAWSRVGNLATPGQQRAYLMRIVLNEALQILRYPHRRWEQLDADVGEHAATQESFEGEIQAREDLRLVWRAISELPEMRRQVVLLRAAGYEYKEIAARLGVAQSTVRSHISDARKQLSRAVRRGPEDEVTDTLSTMLGF